MALQDPRRSSEPSWRAAVGSSSADGIRRAKLARLALAAAVVCLGLGLGLGLPSERRPSGSCPASISGGLSGVLGWTYFAAWSASFYPQAIQNYVRRSVVGLSFDFALLNLIAFGCYSAFNLALFLSPTVQAEYAAAHHSSSAVRPNDVFFALHALLISAPPLDLPQVFLYERGGQTFSLPAKAASAAILLGAAARPIRWLDWLAYLNALAAVKLGVTLVKYLPQLLLNARRRSTAGWSSPDLLWALSEPPLNRPRRAAARLPVGRSTTFASTCAAEGRGFPLMPRALLV
ncbi:hypothetical protein EMIHUDRAFT_64713 [Emiliania huxleyi CCMP1516]|uniref:Uncharacterized protein n=2 Tax=Emiliania huxleyi TaxID=2903 RepID=A0A0D3JQD1_EMIH1|nr:hypothetical protein EMIHUDRAFT_64713 [Emiliania huxleyi CCMP1516]EOD25716.1 hypothetical protein EMIHUDRAFT_64713 [Emiliania huxleyi CCMP1516]|eukprot:XP_005778145.1 hypothetical protein EMIHUDRAFT_64713 [Emiliania huxleyi CCMP1516]